MASPNPLSAAAQAAEDRPGLALAAVAGLAMLCAPLSILAAQHPGEVAFGAVALLAVGFCLVRVEAAILLLVAASPLEGAFQPSPTLTITKIAGALCFASFALHALSSQRRLYFDRTHALVLGLLAIALVSTLWADDLASAQATTIRYASFAALYVVISQFVGNERLQRRIAWTLSAACAFTGVLAIGNLLSGSSPQAQVPYTNQNDTAFILATTLPLTFWLLREGRVRAAVALGLLGINAAAIVLTFSRGALVGLAAFAVWQLVVERKRVAILLVGAAVAALATFAFVHTNSKQVEQGLVYKQQVAQENVSTRLEAWRAAGSLLESHPVFGVGPGNFRDHYFEATGRPVGTENLGVVHNAYLDVAAEVGFPAA